MFLASPVSFWPLIVRLAKTHDFFIKYRDRQLYATDGAVTAYVNSTATKTFRKMKNLGFPHLINTKIYSVSQLFFKESNGIEFNINDSLILESDKGLLQILNDYNQVNIFSIASVKSAKILGDLDTDQAEIYVKNTKEVANGGTIQSIHNYTQASTYFFGSKFLDNKEDFVLGFCYGFDEIVCLSEPEFESLLSNYNSSNVNVNVNVITLS